jgi:transcriptional regulator with XRE-family HTH domain
MKKANTNHREKQMATVGPDLLRPAHLAARRVRRKMGIAADFLRAERGAMQRIARRLGVHPSLVSRVARGKKTSERVRVAIIRYLLGRQRELATAALLIEHSGQARR